MPPFKSEAQRRKFAQMLNEKKISKKVLTEWNAATGKTKLPERLHPAKEKPKSSDDLRAIHRARFGLKK